LAGTFLAGTFLALTFFAGAFFATAFFATTFLAGAFLATAFFAGAFFAGAFLATAFFALFLSALNTATIVLWFLRFLRISFLRTARSDGYIIPRIAADIASDSTKKPSWPKSEEIVTNFFAFGTRSAIST